MTDIEVVEFTGRRRFDPITAASVVLTVDAAVFLVLAVVGAPFLMFVFADDYTGTWPQMAPLVTWWLTVALLGAACATAVVRSFGSGGVRARRLGAVAAIATVVVVAVLIATTFEQASMLALFGGLVAIANVAAAGVLIGPDRTDPAEDEFEAVFLDEPELEDEPEAELEDEDEPEAVLLDEAATEDEAGFEAGTEPGERAEPRVTVDLARTGPGRAVPSAARRRLRGRAAMQTHAGVRMTRRRPDR